MQNKIYCLFALLFIGLTIQAQTSIQDKDIVWFGLDFSQAKLIGSEGFTNPDDIVDNFFNKWNNLIKAESEKYDVKKFYTKSDLTYDLKPVKIGNEKVDADTVVTEDEYEITEEQVAAAVKALQLDKSTNGLGCVFVVESFDKTSNKGNIWVTFFDIATKKVLKTKKYQGKSGGFGLRNFWAKSVYNVLKQSGKEFENGKM